MAHAGPIAGAGSTLTGNHRDRFKSSGFDGGLLVERRRPPLVVCGPTAPLLLRGLLLLLC